MLIIGWVTAYVDESLRLTGEGLYVLAAVVVPEERSDEVRAALRAALPSRMLRYHWRDEGRRSRAAMVRLVDSLRLDALAVTATPVLSHQQERGRRRCLPTLLWELERHGIGRVVLESRQHRDGDDGRMFAYARRAGWISGDLRYGFARPADECLLWLPDIVAGAVTAAADGDASYLRLLAVPVLQAP